MTGGGPGPASRAVDDAAAGVPTAQRIADLVVSRRLAVGGTLLAGLAGAGTAFAGDAEARIGPTRSAAARSAVDPRSVSWARTRRDHVALTFDDGPDPATTPDVLDLLAAHGARATFFVVGRTVDEHPELVARMVAEGHLLANHTYDHAPLEQLTRSEVADQIARGRAAISRFAGGPRYLRPPRGYTSRTVAAVARQLGERQVFWSCCLDSTRAPSDAARGVALAAGLGRGDIVLLHDGGRTTGRWGQSYDRRPTVAGLATLLEGLGRSGLQAVTLDVLLGDR